MKRRAAREGRHASCYGSEGLRGRSRSRGLGDLLQPSPLEVAGANRDEDRDEVPVRVRLRCSRRRRYALLHGCGLDEPRQKPEQRVARATGRRRSPTRVNGTVVVPRGKPLVGMGLGARQSLIRTATVPRGKSLIRASAVPRWQALVGAGREPGKSLIRTATEERGQSLVGTFGESGRESLIRARSVWDGHEVECLRHECSFDRRLNRPRLCRVEPPASGVLDTGI